MQTSDGAPVFSFVSVVQGKEVISEEEGDRLGRIDSIVVDITSMTVEAFPLRNIPRRAPASPQRPARAACCSARRSGWATS